MDVDLQPEQDEAGGGQSMMMTDDNDDLDVWMNGMDDDGMCQEGGKIRGRGRDKFTPYNFNSKGNGGATRNDMVEEVKGRKSLKNAMKLMMDRASTPKLISKTIQKKKQGAKSRNRKGKLLGALLTDSSQLGIRRFLLQPKRIINGMEIGHGVVNSLGNTMNCNRTRSKDI